MNLNMNENVRASKRMSTRVQSVKLSTNSGSSLSKAINATQGEAAIANLQSPIFISFSKDTVSSHVNVLKNSNNGSVKVR